MESLYKELGGAVVGLTVSGFKSIRKPRSLFFAPLTILAGSNSSGKSSIIQPLLLLKQTLDDSIDPGPLLLDGSNIGFDQITQLFHVDSKGIPSERFTVSLMTSNSEVVTITYKQSSSRSLAIDKYQYTRLGGNEFKLSEEMKAVELNKQFDSKVVPGEFKQFRQELRVVRNRCFLQVVRYFDSEDSSISFALPETPDNSILSYHIRRIIHVPGLRGNPRRVYRSLAAQGSYPGTFDNYVASVLNKWSYSKSNSDKRKLTELGKDLRRLGLTSSIRVDRLTDTTLAVSVSRNKRKTPESNNDYICIADVGIGVSQVLPVLVALLEAEKGQVVIIEQPEIHLHPNAQVKLANAFCAAAKRGVIVVVETHSGVFIRAIQHLVSTKKLNHEWVSLNWFRKNSYGETNISDAVLDKYGRSGDWPADFSNVSMNVERQFLASMQKRMFEDEDATE